MDIDVNSLSPMMRRYFAIKAQYPDCLLFFRLGDFYEMFFEDAEKASRVLDLVLTGRDCGLKDRRAPMCGVPYHAVDNYIRRLIDAGFRVAICEQLSDPATTKGMLDRDVVRVVTPGTVMEEDILDEKSTNYLANALMAREAREKGVNVTFSFDEQGFLAEAAIANVAMVDRAGRMLMPEFRHALPGTTSIRAMELAKAFMPVVLTDITEEILEQASEILVLGTTCECVAVTHYNGKPVGDGRPGPMADRLRHLLHDALVTGGVPFLE